MNALLFQTAQIFTKANWEKVLKSVATWCLGFGKNLLIAIIMLVVGNKLIKCLLKFIGKANEKSKLEPIVTKFLSSLIKFGLYGVLAIVIIGILGIPASSFIAVLSAAGLTIGLAFQGSLSNFAGGVLILLFKPFKIGDFVKEDVHGNEGLVEGIDLFYTRMRTFDNKMVIIPNGSLANTSITNYTANNKRRIEIKVGISYDSDMKRAKDILMNVINSQDGILKNEDNKVYVDALEESQITIGTMAWVMTDDYWKIKWELTEKFKNALDDAGIEIPFNQLSVTINEKQRK